MSELDTILAPVEQKWGRFITVKDLGPLAAKHVAELTDDDLRIIEAFHGPHARAEKEAARARWTTPVPPTVPVETPTAAVPATVGDPADDALTWEGFVAKHAEAPMTLSLTAALIQPLADQWKAMNARNKERNARLDALEQELAALKSSRYLRDAGDWKAGGRYEKGDVARFSGSIWICTSAHEATGPTVDHSHWRLWIKRQRDGR